MTSGQPPAMASWLVERFCADPGLAGDLIEEYARRRSVLWYWRQAFAAVGAYSTSQIRQHKWLTIRAIATGYVIWYVLNVTLLQGVIHPWMASDTTLVKTAYMVLAYVLWLANGWTIAKLHRPHSTAMVFAYVVWSVVASVPPVYEAALSAFAGSSGGSALAWELFTRSIVVVTLLAGGTLAVYRDQLKQTRTASPGWPPGSPRAFAAR